MSKRKAPAGTTAGPRAASSRKSALLAASRTNQDRTRGRPLVAPGKARQNKRSIAIYMDQIVKDELDAIALAERTSIQALGLEAINLLLVRYGRKAIA